MFTTKKPAYNRRAVHVFWLCVLVFLVSFFWILYDVLHFSFDFTEKCAEQTTLAFRYEKISLGLGLTTMLGLLLCWAWLGVKAIKGKLDLVQNGFRNWFFRFFILYIVSGAILWGLAKAPVKNPNYPCQPKAWPVDQKPEPQ